MTETVPTHVSLPPLGLIVAMSRNRCIGKDGTLPWRIPEDLQHFKAVTTGHAILMGRKTYESIGRPLPRRRSIVITRRSDYAPEGCEVASNFSDALATARDTDPMPIVIGGATIYEIALPRVTRIWLTELDLEVEGDTFFPPLVPGEWEEVERRPGESAGVTFITLDRLRLPGASIPPAETP